MYGKRSFCTTWVAMGACEALMASGDIQYCILVPPYDWSMPPNGTCCPVDARTASNTRFSVNQQTAEKYEPTIVDEA